MGQPGGNEPASPRSSLESTNASVYAPVVNGKGTPSGKSQYRSPQKGPPLAADAARDQGNRDIRIQELLVKLHREEKIRDAAGAMLADLHYGQGQHKHHGNMIRQLNNLNTLKSDAQHKKKVKAQFEAAEREVQGISEQLRELGLDEDDEVSSGDDEGPVNSSFTFFGDESSTALDDDSMNSGMPPIPPPTPGLTLSLSAASSSTDLPALLTQSPGSAAKEASPVTALSPEGALRYVTMLVEGLNSKAGDTKVKADKIAETIRSCPGVKPELSTPSFWTLVVESLKPFFLEVDPAVLYTGLRLARLLMVDASSAAELRTGLHLDYVLLRSLAKDDSDENHNERLQAVQVVRTMLSSQCGNGCELSPGLCRAIVAVAEQSRDQLRFICLETLAELMVIDPEKAFEVNAAKVLLWEMTEPEIDAHRSSLSSDKTSTSAFPLALATVFTGAADNPRLRRAYLRDGKDLSTILTLFTDVQLYGFAQPSVERIKSAVSVMKILLRSWTGVSCFDMELMVQCMTIPIRVVQESLLDVVAGVLWIPEAPTGPAKGGSSANNASTVYRQFTAVLLRKLQQAGLQEQLVELQIRGENETVRQKAQHLSSKIFLLSAQVVPRHNVVQKSMEIPATLQDALAKAPPFSLPTASRALFGSESELHTIKPEEGSSIDSFIRIGTSLDDASFKKLLNATRVLDTKLFRQWNWDALMEFVQGPLRSSKRVEEVTRGSKFMKRLLSFYRPFKYRFSNLTITKEHLRYVSMAKELIRSLLATPEGVRYLSANKLFRQIAECFAQLDPLSGIKSNEPLFSVRRFRSTLCCAYSEMVGVLSGSAVGQQIMAQMRIFNMFYRVCDINRDDVVRSVICSLDYKLEGHPRLILAKALTSPLRNIRLYATEFVGSQLALPDPQFWAVELLVEQLYDVDVSVANAAAYSLHRMCAANVQTLDYVISLRPFLNHLGDHAEPLRIQFMSRPQGFELLEKELKDSDLEHWAPRFNEAYVDKIEGYLETGNTMESSMISDSKNAKHSEPFTFPSYSRPSRRTYAVRDGPPAHFLGELALTDQGCRFLQTKGIIDDLSSTIRETAQCASKDDWSAEELRKAKGALWAIGHIASRIKGALILNVEIADSIRRICDSATVFSLKGTAHYALGLFALSGPGAEYIHQIGWDVVYDIYSRPVGVTLPPAQSLSTKLGERASNGAGAKTSFAFAKYSVSATSDGWHMPTLAMKLIDGTVKEASQDDEMGHDNGALDRKENDEEKSDGQGSDGQGLNGQETVIPEISRKEPPEPEDMISEDTSGFEDARETSRLSVETMSINIPETARDNGVGKLDFGSKSTPTLILPKSEAALSPTSRSMIQTFDFEVDPNISRRRSSCFDLIDSAQRRGSPRSDPTKSDILEGIAQLGSYVLAQRASKKLVATRASDPTQFQDVDTFKEAMSILASGHYKQVAHKFVFELFDTHAVLDKLYRRKRKTVS